MDSDLSNPSLRGCLNIFCFWAIRSRFEKMGGKSLINWGVENAKTKGASKIS